MANRRPPPKTPKAFLESFGALRYIPRFFRLIWSTSPSLTGLNIAARLLQSLTPVGLLYVGKLIIDSVVAHIASPGLDLVGLWRLIALELGLVLLSDVLSRIITLTDSLVIELYSNRVSVELIEKAAA